MGPSSRALHLLFLRGLAACLLAVGGAAQAAALVTIVEGEAQLLDGARAVQAAEGLKIGDETLLHTGPRTQLVRVEWADGTAADFGPDTRAMIAPGALGRGGRGPAVYLLQGWVKLSALGSAPAAGVTGPRFELPAFKGAVLVLSQGDETWVFAESGTAAVTERDLKGAPLPLKNGEVYTRAGAAKGTVAPRPTPAQMQRVPRGFRDSLPLRTAALKDKPAAAKPGTAWSYAELKPWLLAEPPLRKAWPRRLAERTRDPAFRQALAENLATHPDWEPVLFPERFNKAASAPR